MSRARDQSRHLPVFTFGPSPPHPPPFRCVGVRIQKMLDVAERALHLKEEEIASTMKNAIGIGRRFVAKELSARDAEVRRIQAEANHIRRQQEEVRCSGHVCALVGSVGTAAACALLSPLLIPFSRATHDTTHLPPI